MSFEGDVFVCVRLSGWTCYAMLSQVLWHVFTVTTSNLWQCV